ncbi:hypothetical protein [Desulfofustis glycolicus]|uniref:Uncharacterized protein n=1 Tax=Desulfofustis glycolicus DSM 9705 TaxID=1121409 RepID=A0A1M5YN06_9BACT|nr:hypothetical protein [Desulfofustis glycolicus]SHI12953.1 hypothetical protein SAMN02745124_04194 [Desulfofustis glycolicus DSM 9705]
MAAKKKGAGGSLNRSQVVTVRLDPKLRYLAELAALKQRRTLSSYIEWAVQESLKNVYLAEGSGYNNDHGCTVHDEGDRLWDVDEPDRFAMLALRYPELLTHDEQIRWKLIRENGYLWKGRYVAGKWKWQVSEDSLIYKRLREYWDKFCAVADGEKENSVLPTWIESEPEDPSPEPPPFPGPDEDIPF